MRQALQNPAVGLTESTEMYLKALAELGGEEPVSMARLAKRLGITPVSANERINLLAAQGLVTHLPYKGAALTEAGRPMAYNVIRRQRLWECFLHDQLKLEWQSVYEFACDLEHATTPAVTEALAAYLGHPTHCPHGNPIPGPNGQFEPLQGILLSRLPLGQNAQILAVQATSTEVFRYLAQRRLLPGRCVSVVEKAPLQGPLTVEVEGVEVALGLLLAELIVVKIVSH
jgi:DtxR family transcriptional regulator, Mn-dependent transcriptional regulator